MADQNTKLAINIAAEFVGKAAFGQASKAVSSLDRNVTKLGKAIVGVFAAQKLLAYSKTAVVAYKDDAAAAKALTQTLDNLGLAFEDSRAKTLVANMEKQYKVADDFLRPALGKLLQVTGSLSMSQDILKTALNASAGSGTDLGTTVQDLSQAYVGNLRGLRKYNLGLSQAELQTKSFAQIQELLNAKFKDQAYIKAQDPLNALALASNNAKEIIGKGLVDAINDAVGAGTGVNDITTNIEALATGVSKVITLLGKVTGFFTYGAKGLIQSGKDTLGFFGLGGSNSLSMPKGSYTKGGGKAIDLAAAARAKAEQDAIKRNKELLALAQKQALAAAAAAKAKKEQAILDKVGQLFNMELIQNIAALQGKVTKDEELRLKTQQALLLGNADAAGQLAINLLKSQEEAMKARMIQDPFGGWTSSALEALKAIQAMIDALKALGVKAPAVSYMPTISTAAGTLYTSSTGLSSNDLNAGTFSQYYQGLSGGLYGSTPVNQPIVNVTVQGSVTSEQDLVSAVVQGIYNKQAAGTPITYNTIM